MPLRDRALGSELNGDAFTMSNCNDEEDQFFESLDRIAFTSGSDTEEDNDYVNGVKKCQNSLA